MPCCDIVTKLSEIRFSWVREEERWTNWDWHGRVVNVPSDDEIYPGLTSHNHLHCETWPILTDQMLPKLQTLRSEEPTWGNHLKLVYTWGFENLLKRLEEYINCKFLFEQTHNPKVVLSRKVSPTCLMDKCFLTNYRFSFRLPTYKLFLNLNRF